jgi:hypothetical protein
MHPKREIIIMVSAAAGLLFLVMLFYLLFQNERIYPATLGKVTQNYRNDNGHIYKAKVPYEQFSANKMLRWDADLYNNIKENGYDTISAGGDYIFAFFPLFPFIWKITGLTAVQISLVNYFLWISSLIMLILLFTNKETKYRWRYFIVQAGIPMLVVFLIPYTEGLYMITMTFALWGLLKNKYGLYFIGALLASMTRQSVSILLLTVFFTEFYFFVRQRQLSKTLKSFVLKALPLIIGTVFVSLIQYSYGSDHVTKFIEVEKYWGFGLKWPGAFTDWAHEQYCTNLPLMLIILPALVAFLGYHTFRNLASKKPADIETTPESSEKENREYLYILSTVYLIGISLTILILKGGALNGLSRFVFCTPFYVIALFMLRDKVSRVDQKILAMLFAVVVILAMSAFFLFSYSKSWNFSDLGFFLFFFQIAFFTFTKLISNRWLLAAFILLSALWASFLFSMFLSNAWLVT